MEYEIEEFWTIFHIGCLLISTHGALLYTSSVGLGFVRGVAIKSGGGLTKHLL